MSKNFKEFYNWANKKAGRNIFLAVGVGLLLVGIIGFCVFFNSLCFVILILTFVVFASIELYSAFSENNIHIYITPILLGDAAIILFSYFDFNGLKFFVHAIVMSLLLVLVWAVYDSKYHVKFENGVIHSLAATVFTVFYLPVLASFSVFILLSGYGQLKLVLIVVVVVMNDTCAYIVGRKFGKHKMSPRISPNKTWEGFAGGLLGSIVSAFIVVDVFFTRFAPDLSFNTIVFPLVSGICFSLAAVFGDLCESAIKRSLHKKDMSHMLGGHGGFLDRIDSALTTLPIAYFIFLLFAI